MKQVQNSVVYQNQEIQHFQMKVLKQIKNLQKLIKGESVVEETESSNESKPDGGYNIITSDPRRPIMRKNRDRGLSKAMRKITHTDQASEYLGPPGLHTRKKSMNALMPSNFQDPIIATREDKAQKKKIKFQKSKSFHQTKHYAMEGAADKEESKEENSSKKNKIVVFNVKDQYQDGVRLLNQGNKIWCINL